jgi:hypothetical protein
VRDCRRSVELIPTEQRRKAKLACDVVGDGAPPWLKSCHLDFE